MTFILIDNYDSFTFNLFQMLQPIVSNASDTHGSAAGRRSDTHGSAAGRFDTHRSASLGSTASGPRLADECTELKQAEHRSGCQHSAEPGEDEMAAERIRVFRNDEIDFEAIRAMKPSRVVLSPGPGHPANDSDFGVCKDIILRRKELGCPVLGVCLGHQGIAHHLGGSVVRAPHIVHGKSSRIKVLKRIPLFDGLPDVFEAMRYHSLIAREDNLPPELEVVAKDTDNGLIMAMRHKTEPLYGVQFHPESIGTPEGLTILRNFVEKC